MLQDVFSDPKPQKRQDTHLSPIKGSLTSRKQADTEHSLSDNQLEQLWAERARHVSPARPQTPSRGEDQPMGSNSPLKTMWNAIVNRLSPRKKSSSPLPAVCEDNASEIVNPSLEDTMGSLLENCLPMRGNEDNEYIDDVQDFEDPRRLDQIPDPEGLALDTEEYRASIPYHPKSTYSFPPDTQDVKYAVADLTILLRPPKSKGRGYKPCNLDVQSQKRLTLLLSFLNLYMDLERRSPGVAGNWTRACNSALVATGRKPSFGRTLKQWARNFIADRSDLPQPSHGGGTRSAIDDDDIQQDITIELLRIGKYARPEDIVKLCQTPEMIQKLEHTISLSTARRWLLKMGYRWSRNPRGQYVDGHERADIVDYRQTTYVPKVILYMESMRRWIDKYGWTVPPHVIQVTILWFHDECTFYANDRRHSQWMAPGSSPVPRPKGEGTSLMVADFVSADYGWLRSPDGTESARVLFRAGKNREGYFTNHEIIDQFEKAVNIVRRHYPGENHVFVYDNATTHLKREEGSLSASKMPKNPSDTFGVEVSVLDEAGKRKYASDGTVLKTKVPMEGALFKGDPQPLYFPTDHPKYPGHFKGMAQILTERGYNVSRKKAQCAQSFNDCPPGATSCCCRRMLYNEPDFAGGEPRLVTVARAHSVTILFLPKYHCELNFIEQCWGHAKRSYRLLPLASTTKDAVMEKNVVDCLDSIPIETMRKYATRALRFTDAYHKGLNGSLAAWAAKKYRGHRVLPSSYQSDLMLENVL